MLVVLGGLDEQLVGDLLVELGLAGPDHVGRARRGIGVDGVALAKLARQPHQVGVDVGGCDVPQPLVFVREIDRAPVTELADRQVGEILQGGIGIERAGEELARGREEGHSLRRTALVLVDAGMIEGLGRVLRGGEHEGPLLLVELVGRAEAQGDGAERAAPDRERDHGEGREQDVRLAQARVPVAELNGRLGPDRLARPDR